MEGGSVTYLAKYKYYLRSWTHETVEIYHWPFFYRYHPALHFKKAKLRAKL